MPTDSMLINIVLIAYSSSTQLNVLHSSLVIENILPRKIFIQKYPFVNFSQTTVIHYHKLITYNKTLYKQEISPLEALKSQGKYPKLTC